NGAGGVAGVGGQTSDLRFYKIAFDYILPVGGGIGLAAKQGAKIINVSSGFPCKPGGGDFCDGGTRAGFAAVCLALPFAWLGGPLAVAAALAACAALTFALTFDAITNGVKFAFAMDAVVNAGGGNDDVDPAKIKWLPCFAPQ